MEIIDLHMHTNVSDGTDTPRQLIGKIAEEGIQLFSITDHDAIDGAIEAQHLLKENPGDIRFIRGVELSCRDELGKYHILGYQYRTDHDNPLVQLVNQAHELRIEKVYARLEFLKTEFGMTFEEKDINNLFRNSNPGKPHIAKMMMAYGYARDIQDAMKRYLNKKKFPNKYIRPEQAITAILESGGIPILAHPAYGDGDQMILGDEMEERLKHLMDFGIAGMECYYSGFTPRIMSFLLELADRNHLYVTAGSDYHGTNKMVHLKDTNLSRVSEGDRKSVV